MQTCREMFGVEPGRRGVRPDILSQDVECRHHALSAGQHARIRTRWPRYRRAKLSYLNVIRLAVVTQVGFEEKSYQADQDRQRRRGGGQDVHWETIDQT